jgi:hypothetical protein
LDLGCVDLAALEEDEIERKKAADLREAPPLPPGAPVILCVTPSVAALAWAADPPPPPRQPAECFEMRYCPVTASGTEWVTFSSRLPPLYPYGGCCVISDLRPSTRYVFQVRAKNANGWSEPSNTVRGWVSHVCLYSSWK